MFQLWANVNTSLLGLEEAITCLRDDIATAIRQRVEMPNFADEFQEWIDRTNEELRDRADEDERVDIDETISNAVQAALPVRLSFCLSPRAVGTAVSVYTELTTLVKRP